MNKKTHVGCENFAVVQVRRDVIWFGGERRLQPRFSLCVLTQSAVRLAQQIVNALQKNHTKN